MSNHNNHNVNSNPDGNNLTARSVPGSADKCADWAISGKPQ